MPGSLEFYSQVTWHSNSLHACGVIDRVIVVTTTLVAMVPPAGGVSDGLPLVSKPRAADRRHYSANTVERDAALRRQTTRAREGKVREEHHAQRD